MKFSEHKSRLIIVSLFVTLFIVFGSGYDAAGVFFVPMVRDLGWSRTRLSSLQTVLALTAGMTAPLVGWLLDRIEARVVVSIGVALCGAGFLLASQATSFALMTGAFFMLGAGLSAATLLPCSLVIANWFGQRRGAALGVTMAGTSLGGMAMTLVASRIIAASGWRAAFAALALPMFLVVLPLVAWTVTTRPPGKGDPGGSERAMIAAGLDIGQALRARSFWMIALAQFCYSFAGAGATLHTIPYLILMGYRPQRAAQVMSVTFGLASLGKPIAGYAADYLSGRIALAVTLVLAALGQSLLLGAPSATMVGAYALCYGLASGAPLALIPMLIADTLGLKRYGSLGGLTGLFMTAGAASGPLAAGWMFDEGFGYAVAFALFVGMLAAGAIAAVLSSPFTKGVASLKGA
jgi:MFS family permease